MGSLQQKFEHILAIEDEKNQRMVTLKHEIYTLGRSPKNSIVIYDRKVSRLHATVLRQKKLQTNQLAFWIIDGDRNGNRSTNGIIINGKPCLSHKLKIGDTILLGNTSKIKYYKFSIVALKKILKTGQSLNQSILEKMFLRQEDNKKTMVI